MSADNTNYAQVSLWGANDDRQQMLNEIGAGRSQAVSSQYLADTLGVRKTTVRDLKQQLVAAGWPIIASGQGYYLPDSDAEFREAMRRLDREIQTRQETMQQLARAWYGSRQTPVMQSEAQL